MITYYSQNKDDWHGSHTLKCDLIEKMLALDPELSGTVKVYESDFAQPKLLNICIDAIVDCIAECYSDDCPDDIMYDSFYDLLDHTAIDELKELIDNWANKHDLNPNWLNPVGKIREIYVNVDEYKDDE